MRLLKTGVRQALDRLSDRASKMVDQAKIAGGHFDGAQVIVCGESIRIAEAQVAPILDRVKDLRVESIERRSANAPRLWKKSQPKIAFIQSYWDTPFEEVRDCCELIRDVSPRTRICYLDWHAPASIAEPRIVDLVDVYVKKNLLKDRSRYISGIADTNLAEYESQWDPSFVPTTTERLTEAQLDKVFLGWSFATDRSLLGKLRAASPEPTPRSIALHCRIAAPEQSGWYSHMRRRSLDAAASLSSNEEFANDAILVENKPIANKEYMDELSRSRACFSPFGFGEVCWRDFEAVVAGATLIKPDMSHLAVLPDFYIPGVTYLPVKWDFSDLADVYRESRDEGLRQRLTREARDRWHEFLDGGWDLMWARLLDRLLA